MQSMDLAALLRRLPHSLQRCPEVSYALEAHRAMTQQGSLAFLQLQSRGTWMQQAIMLPRLQQVCIHSGLRADMYLLIYAAFTRQSQALRWTQTLSRMHWEA